MLKNLSRIFGITGGILALSTALYCIIDSIDHRMLLNLYYYNFSTVSTIPFVIASAGLAGVFLINKKPVLAGVLITASGQFILPSLSPMLPSMHLITIVLVLLIPALLTAAGVLAHISAYKTSGSKSRFMLKEFSYTSGVTSAALNMLIWLFLIVQGLYAFSHSVSGFDLTNLAASAAGLLGSLLLRKKTVPGAVLMLTSGAFILFFTSRLSAYNLCLNVMTLLLIASGILALVSAGKTPVSNEPQNENPDSAI